MALLLTTMISLSINYTCYENFGDQNRDNYLFKTYLLPDYFYSKSAVLAFTWVSLIICFTFLPLPAALSLVQARNFCLNKTQSERFARKKGN